MKKFMPDMTDRDRLNKLGQVKFLEVREMMPGYCYRVLRETFIKIMDEKIKAGEAEKLANGRCWISKNKFCKN